jgi:putative sterol carrier protein
VSIRFLSADWASAVTDALNEDAGFRKEIKQRRSTVTWHVETADGEVEYHLAMDEGRAELALGPPKVPGGLNLWASYADVVAISRGELDGRQAFQSKRLRSDTRLIGVLKHLGVFHNLNRVVADLDVDY